MSLDVYKLDESILGVSSPDPLRFAFTKFWAVSLA